MKKILKLLGISFAIILFFYIKERKEHKEAIRTIFQISENEDFDLEKNITLKPNQWYKIEFDKELGTRKFYGFTTNETATITLRNRRAEWTGVQDNFRSHDTYVWIRSNEEIEYEYDIH